MSAHSPVSYSISLCHNTYVVVSNISYRFLKRPPFVSIRMGTVRAITLNRSSEYVFCLSTQLCYMRSTEANIYAKMVQSLT